MIQTFSIGFIFFSGIVAKGSVEFSLPAIGCEDVYWYMVDFTSMAVVARFPYILRGKAHTGYKESRKTACRISPDTL